MNSPSPTDPPDRAEDSQVELSAALIAELGLSDIAVQRIYEFMDSMGTTFAEAAGRLGIMQPEAIERALHKIRNAARPSDEVGLVETAVRRIAADRRIVLRQGE